MSDIRPVAADLGGWQRRFHAEEVWGTVVTFDLRGEQLPVETPELVSAAAAFLHQVDAWFSTFRIDSDITALRNGLRLAAQMPEVVQAVLRACDEVRELTAGAFDPWAVPGGIDPSGYVKGWAADAVAKLFLEQGLANVCVNAAGDVVCRGEQAPGAAWSIGIRHPEREFEIIRRVQVRNGAVATSGMYERGAHIHRPGGGGMALTAATVVGPDGGLADALATALVVAGEAGREWFARLPGWSALLVSGDRMSHFGPAFAD